MTEREQQVFKACEHMKAKGHFFKKDFTYRAIQAHCIELGFPAGNTKTLKKYRQAWLEKNFPNALETASLFDESEFLAPEHATENGWQTQIKSLESINQQQREEYLAREEKLEAYIQSLKKQLDDIRSDFFRQEALIDSLHRERSDFYKSFSVMKKQFEQLPRWQDMLQSQQNIMALLEKSTSDS